MPDPTPTSPTRPRELRSLPALGSAVLAGRTHLLVGAALGLLAGLLVALVSPTTYAATATVRVGSGLVPVGDFRPDTLWADDQVALANTPPVREAVAERIGGDVDADDVATRLGIVAETDANYLVFTWTAGSAEEAERGADAAALAYLDSARDEAEQRWQGHDNLLVALIEDLGPDDPRSKGLAEERVSLQETIVDPGKVAGEAAGTARQTSLGAGSHVLAGTLGGLVLGVVSAYLALLRRGGTARTATAGPRSGVRWGVRSGVRSGAASGGGLLAGRVRLPRRRPRPTPAGPGAPSVGAAPAPGAPTARDDARDDHGMPVLLEAGATGSPALGRALVAWVLRHEQAGSAAAARLGAHATPGAPAGAVDVVRTALRDVGVEGRVEVVEVDTARPTWRDEFAQLDGVVVVTGDDARSDEAVGLARLHLDAVDVEVLGLVRVGGGERG